MSVEQNTGLITIHENGDANSYSLIGQNGDWVLALLHNGKPMLEQQRANLRHVAACWNACDGVPTDDLEQLGAAGVLSLTGLTEQYRQERDLLLAELKFVHRYWDQLNSNDAGRIKTLIDRMLDLKLPPAVPQEAAAIGAVLDSESLEQGEPQ